MDNILNTVKLYKKKKNAKNNRLGFPDHEGCVFGLIRARYKGTTDLSLHSKKYPDVYEELKKIDVPIQYTSIQINKNLVCPKHKDKHNVGDSYIISFGNYTGGELVIEGIPYDTRKGLIFNGYEKEHWNNPIIGNKYSVIFFSI
jgi:hypothetical protein